MDDPHERVRIRVEQMSIRRRAYFVQWLADYDPDGLERMLDKYEAERPRPETQSGP